MATRPVVAITSAEIYRAALPFIVCALLLVGLLLLEPRRALTRGALAGD
jgi:TRAP-type mannitol/chloroaromatic compound transport system permease large subunit